MKLRGYPTLFTYSGQDDADLRDHSQQEAMVLSCLSADEVDEAEVGRMFRVRFTDGLERDAFEDELLCLHDGEEDASDCLIGGRE